MASDTVGRPMEILLVEDSLSDARLTIEALKEGRVQHRLTYIRDGIEAVEFLFRQGKFARAPRPDVILLDLQLPCKDGREVLAELKADEQLRRIPVVILTASKDHEETVRSELLSCDSYMTKPIDMDQFIAVVKQLKRFWLADVILPCAH